VICERLTSMPGVSQTLLPSKAVASLELHQQSMPASLNTPISQIPGSPAEGSRCVLLLLLRIQHAWPILLGQPYSQITRLLISSNNTSGLHRLEGWASLPAARSAHCKTHGFAWSSVLRTI
jgi:hypothetical protein